MESYIDIHSHILPGIDDGSENFEMSMKMLRAAQADGTAGIILTPHNKPARHNAGAERIYALMDRLKAGMREEGFSIKLYAGNEIYYRKGLTEEITEGKALTLAGSSYVLAEFSPMDGFAYIRDGLYELLAGGYRPVLAHVERYANVCAGVEKVESLVKMGCYMQVNAESVMGKAGFGIRQTSRRLLKEGLVHFIASDAHDMSRRKPGLSDCVVYVSRKFGSAHAAKLFYENSMHVVRDENI